MIRQYNALPVGIEQVLGYSGKGKRLRLTGLVLVLLAFAAGAYCAEEGTRVDDHEGAVAALAHAQTTNVICPVMTDMKAEPDIFTDYQGKRVNFCCLSCRAAFRRNPEKYLSLLPQFGGVVADITHDHENYGPWLTLPGLIKPVGIATLSCLVLTVAAALLRRKNPKFLFKWHKRLGIATLVFAVIHLILVLIAH
jgi:YHS domain-containing protein